LSKLSCITQKRDDFRRIVIPLWLIAGASCFRTSTPSAIKSEQAVSGPCSVATHAPANDDEQIPVLGPQAPGEEIAVFLLATTAPLGQALADPFAEAPPHVSPVLHKVDDEISQILPGPYPVPEEIAQIAFRVAISVAPSLG
jgi:hypothetical protein